MTPRMRAFALLLVLAVLTAVCVSCTPAPPAEDSTVPGTSGAGESLPSEDPSEAAAPSEEPSREPAEASAETSAEESVEESVEDPAETSAEEPSETPSEEPSPEPSQEPSQEPLEESSEAPSEEPDTSEPGETSEESKGEEPVVRTWPCLSGTFIQPGAFNSFTVERWEQHLGYLLEAGIDTVIVQWVSETPYGKVKTLYYPTKENFETAGGSLLPVSQLLPNLLKAAESKGVKVFVGLNLADEWWSIACTQLDWNQKQAELGIRMAKEIYGLYKAEYPNAMHGWYFAWEMFNGMQGNEEKAAGFLNQYLDPLTELDPSMPLMLSPFVRASGGTAEAAQKEWTKVFASTHFRQNDIFCCQDSVGAGHIVLSQLDGYFKALKNAVDTKEGLLFWANNECFTKDYKPRPLADFLQQMKIAEPYVSGYVTFAYSHYYSPDVPNKTFNSTYHDAYVRYYNTGSPDGN